jgi:hypothetical protein
MDDQEQWLNCWQEQDDLLPIYLLQLVFFFG